MSNDLISRSELKEIAGKYKDEIFTYDEVLELIDLAPAAISDSQLINEIQKEADHEHNNNETERPETLQE